MTMGAACKVCWVNPTANNSPFCSFDCASKGAQANISPGPTNNGAYAPPPYQTGFGDPSPPGALGAATGGIQHMLSQPQPPPPPPQQQQPQQQQGFQAGPIPNNPPTQGSSAAFQVTNNLSGYGNNGLPMQPTGAPSSFANTGSGFPTNQPPQVAGGGGVGVQGYPAANNGFSQSLPLQPPPSQGNAVNAMGYPPIVNTGNPAMQQGMPTQPSSTIAPMYNGGQPMGGGGGGNRGGSRLCSQCWQKPVFVEANGRAHDYCGRHCAGLAKQQQQGPSGQGASSHNAFNQQPQQVLVQQQYQQPQQQTSSGGIFSIFGLQSSPKPVTSFGNGPRLCMNCKQKPVFVEADGHAHDYCGKTCAGMARQQRQQQQQWGGAGVSAQGNSGGFHHQSGPKNGGMCLNCNCRPMATNAMTGGVSDYCSTQCMSAATSGAGKYGGN